MGTAADIFPHLTLMSLAGANVGRTGSARAHRNQLTLFRDPLRVALRCMKAGAGASLWYMKNNIASVRRGICS